jgi:SHS family lactate transporter-like MFS transporter
VTIGPVLIAVAVLTASGKDATGIQFGTKHTSAVEDQPGVASPSA